MPRLRNRSLPFDKVKPDSRALCLGVPISSLNKARSWGPEMSAKLKVLVADDERVISDTLMLILNNSGLEAVAAYSGEEVVEVANSFQPDILVSDVVMPGMNGIEAAKLVRQMLPSCRIVLLSGQSITAELLDNAREQGHEFEIIAKPLPPSQLIAHLRGETAVEDSA